MLNTRVVSTLCRELCSQAGLGTPTRQPIRVWRLSGVERLRLRDGRTVVFKYATEPFTQEAEVLEGTAARGIPLPALHAWAIRDRTLGMIMQDLGPPSREATDADAAIAAARLHHEGPTPGLERFGQAELQDLPRQALTRLEQLRAAGRFPHTGDIIKLLRTLDKLGPERAVGAELPPFGLCHGELHPTSLHVGSTGWRLLDFAKTFNGPGLLDLATWHGTRQPPDPTRLRHLIAAYVAAGGHPDALTDRGGLPAEVWAPGWHRIWAAAWFIKHAATGTYALADDVDHVQIIRRQLTAATHLLAP